MKANVKLSETSQKEFEMLGHSVREFARKELLPHLPESDRYPAGEGFTKALDSAFDLDFFHVLLPETSNGWGGRITPLALILKQMAEVDAGFAAILLANAAAQEILRLSGADEALAEIATAGTINEFLTAYPLLMHPGEDEITLSASPQNGGYRLAGRAEFVVLAPMASRALLPAGIGPNGEIDFFLVDLRQPGIHMDGPIAGMGLHACPAADLVVANAEGRLVGKPGDGQAFFEQALARMLPAAAAVSCGIMQGSLKEALQYSKKRKQGGRRILDWSELRLLLADMALSVRTAETLLAQALRTVDDGDAKWKEDAYTAAIYILEAACKLTSDGVQALGGYGYTKHHFQERRFRDARHLQCVFGSVIPRRLNFVKHCLNW